jgi:hypothetical protein
MAVQQPTVTIEQKVGVEKRPHADRTLLRNADRQDHPAPFSDLAQPPGVRSRNLHRILKQSAAESVLVHRSIDQVPQRERGNEGLPKHDQVGAGVNRLLNQRFQLIDRGVTVKKYRSRLHRGSAELRICVAWHDDFAPSTLRQRSCLTQNSGPGPWLPARSTFRYQS